MNEVAKCRRDHNRLGFAYQIGFARLFNRFPAQQPLEINDELLSFVAVQMNIDIMRAFVRLRQMIEQNQDIAARVKKLERGQERTASIIEVLVEDIDRLAHEVKHMKALPLSPKRKIGFRLGDED